MGDLHEHNKQNTKTYSKHTLNTPTSAKNILCLDGNYLSRIQRINLERLFSNINPNYCFSFQLILCILYFLTKHCVLCFADLTQESPSAVCNGYETKSRLANTYMRSVFTAWLLLMKVPPLKFFLSVWTLSDAVVSSYATCELRAIIHNKLINLTVLDRPSVLISLGNKYRTTAGTSKVFSLLWQFCF